MSAVFPLYEGIEEMAEEDIKRLVKELRTRMGLTQEQFAAIVGVTFVTVNRWESGKAKPSRLAMMRLEELHEQRIDE